LPDHLKKVNLTSSSATVSFDLIFPRRNSIDA
jgi:hypothetical protein